MLGVVLVGLKRFLRGFKGFKGLEGLWGLWVFWGRRRLLEEEGEVVGFLELGVGGFREAEMMVVVVGWGLTARMEGKKGEE